MNRLESGFDDPAAAADPPDFFMILWRPCRGKDSKSHWSPLSPEDIEGRHLGNWFKDESEVRAEVERLTRRPHQFFLKGLGAWTHVEYRAAAVSRLPVVSSTEGGNGR